MSRATGPVEIWIGRGEEEAGPWLLAAREAGCAPRTLPLVRSETLPLTARQLQCLRTPRRCTWALFCSARAVEIVARVREALPWPDSVQLGAVGPATAARMRQAGWSPSILAPEAGSLSLAEAFLALGLPPGDNPVLLPGARGGRPELRAALEAAGHEVLVVPLYETRPIDGPAPPPGAAVLVFSPSAVRSLRRRSPPGDLRVWAVGPTTAEAARLAGFAVASVLDRPEPQALQTLLRS